MRESIRSRVLHFFNNPILTGLSFSIYAFLIRFYIYPKYAFLLQADVPLIQSFIEWFGVAYGLFIALVLVNVWAQFDTTEREFDREADAIFMLYQSTKQIKDTKKIKPLKAKIIDRIRAYVSHVTNHFQQEHQNLLVRESGDKILEEVRDLIGRLAHTDERESITSELIKEFNEAVDLRGDRISHSKQHIPDPVWGISLAASILWLIPFYGLNFINDWVAITLVGGVTLIVVAILVIIRDLDDPFEGTWKINNSEWVALGEKIEPRLTLYFVSNLDSSRFAAAWAFINQFFANRPCVLHSLLRNAKQKQSFVGGLSGSAYVKIFYKDDYEELYEKIDHLPVIICSSSTKREIIIKSTEINKVATLADLSTLTQERLVAFCSQ